MRITEYSGKIFCVGAGKTGSTSLESFFKEMGFRVGNQVDGELLLRDWAARNFDPIVALARTAQVFQDMPFSCPFTFQAMDMAFPGSKFILSVRNDAEQWYESLTRFHTTLLGKGRLPTSEELKQFPYRYEGWIFEALVLVYGVSEANPYEKGRLISAYENHNRSIEEYFRYRRRSFLKINLAEDGVAEALSLFVGVPGDGRAVPHLNRSR